jgi:ribonuclease P protein component
VLGSPSRARSSHFAVHHVAASPSTPVRRLPKAVLSTATSELSTAPTPDIHSSVDDIPDTAALRPPLASIPVSPQGVWLGTVVPKRHAKRSVTRNLLKRQIRAAFDGRDADLAAGLWVVRLRAPFDRKLFPSASSEALRAAARAELSQLMARVMARSQPAA